MRQSGWAGPALDRPPGEGVGPAVRPTGGVGSWAGGAAAAGGYCQVRQGQEDPTACIRTHTLPPQYLSEVFSLAGRGLAVTRTPVSSLVASTELTIPPWNRHCIGNNRQALTWGRIFFEPR